MSRLDELHELKNELIAQIARHTAEISRLDARINDIETEINNEFVKDGKVKKHAVRLPLFRR